MSKVVGIPSIAGLLVVDFLLSHDILKPGEAIAFPRHLRAGAGAVRDPAGNPVCHPGAALSRLAIAPGVKRLGLVRRTEVIRDD